MKSLAYLEIEGLFSKTSKESLIKFERVRPHNKSEIRKSESATLGSLLKEIAAGIDEGHISGGDMEIPLPASEEILVGHHDGIFWLEKRKC